MKAQDLFKQVTADLVAAIEAGAKEWCMPWRRLGAGLPRSVDGRPYRGWNALVLAMIAGDRGWGSARWATYRGWQRHGCQVRRGERGAHVVLWKSIERHDPAEDGDEDGGVRRSLFARTFTVFDAEQVDGAGVLCAGIGSDLPAVSRPVRYARGVLLDFGARARPLDWSRRSSRSGSVGPLR